MSLPASIIVNVQTDIPPVINTTTGQNTTLFLTDATVDLDTTERVRPYYEANTVGTDLSPDSEAYKAAVGYFSQSPHPNVLYIGVRGVEDIGPPVVAAEDIEIALAACLGKYQFYGVAIDSSYPDADAEKAAEFVQTNIMLYGRSSPDALILDPASTTDFASKMQAMSRVFTFARETTMDDYPEMATLSRTTAVDLTIPNSANTIGVQSLASIQPSTFTQAQFNAATKKNCNIYEVIGPQAVVFPGVMANGLFIEDQYGIDFIQAYITQLAISGIERSKRVPQTNQGMNYLVGYLDTGLAQIVASGFLAAGYWDAESITNVVDNGELLPKGYKIVAAPINTLTPEQRAAGFGSNIGIALKGSGAIHCLNIYMPFNP
jgi:uncharacterized protein DUF3383